MYATEYIVLSEHDLIKEPGQPQWSPSKNVVKDLRTENRKLKDQVIRKKLHLFIIYQSFFKRGILRSQYKRPRFKLYSNLYKKSRTKLFYKKKTTN